MEIPKIPGGSRIGKKQIICYITPEDSELYYQYCLRFNWTRQELLARAINKGLEDLGETARLDYLSKRIFRIPGRKRSVRKNASGRTGKMAIAGWYPVSQVDKISLILSTHDMNYQTISTYGLMTLIDNIED